MLVERPTNSHSTTASYFRVTPSLTTRIRMQRAPKYYSSKNIPLHACCKQTNRVIAPNVCTPTWKSYIKPINMTCPDKCLKSHRLWIGSKQFLWDSETWINFGFLSDCSGTSTLPWYKQWEWERLWSPTAKKSGWILPHDQENVQTRLHYELSFIWTSSGSNFVPLRNLSLEKIWIEVPSLLVLAREKLQNRWFISLKFSLQMGCDCEPGGPFRISKRLAAASSIFLRFQKIFKK